MATAIYSNKEYYDCSVNINGSLLFVEITDLEYKLLVLPGQDSFRTHPKLAKAADSFPGLPDYGRIERVRR